MIKYILRYVISVAYVFYCLIKATLLYPLFLKFRTSTSLFVIHVFYKHILLINGIKLSIEGSENIDKKKKYLIVSNHQSIFDIPIIGTAVPVDMRIFAKKELRKILFFGWILDIYGFVFVDRDNKRDAIKSLKIAKEALKYYSFLIFPEGTRSKDGKLGSFKTAGFSIAEKNNIEILPVAIKNSKHILEKGKIGVNSGTVKIKIFKPIKFDHGIDRKEMTQRLEEKIRHFVEN